MNRSKYTGSDVAPTAIIAPSAEIGLGTIIHDYVVIEDGVHISSGVEIFPHAVIGRHPRGVGSMANKPADSSVTFIGRGSVIGTGATLFAGVVLGENVLIGDGTRIRERCTIGPNSIVGSNCTFQNDVQMGQRSRVIDLSHITAGVEIGDDVFISTGVLTMNDNSFNHGGELLPPSFDTGSSVGGGAVILPGVKIGRHSIVGAGAVVTKSGPDFAIAKGVPAIWRLRPLGDETGTPGPRPHDGDSLLHTAPSFPYWED